MPNNSDRYVFQLQHQESAVSNGTTVIDTSALFYHQISCLGHEKGHFVRFYACQFVPEPQTNKERYYFVTH